MLQGELSAILLTFICRPSCVINIFVLSTLEWPFYTGFTLVIILCIFMNRQKAGMFSATFIPFMFFVLKMLSGFYVCCIYLTLHIHNKVQLLDLYKKK